MILYFQSFSWTFFLVTLDLVAAQMQAPRPSVQMLQPSAKSHGNELGTSHPNSEKIPNISPAMIEYENQHLQKLVQYVEHCKPLITERQKTETNILMRAYNDATMVQMSVRNRLEPMLYGPYEKLRGALRRYHGFLDKVKKSSQQLSKPTASNQFINSWNRAKQMFTPDLSELWGKMQNTKQEVVTLLQALQLHMINVQFKAIKWKKMVYMNQEFGPSVELFPEWKLRQKKRKQIAHAIPQTIPENAPLIN